MQQTTGLSVDNTEALGALSDASIREEDIEAGRYDGAEVRAWLVNWQDVRQRHLQFRGTIGELRRSGGAFEAELRGSDRGAEPSAGAGLSEAVLGRSGRCALVRSTWRSLAMHGTLGGAADRRRGAFSTLTPFGGFDAGWFQHGRLIVTGRRRRRACSGLIKRDAVEAGPARDRAVAPAARGCARGRSAAAGGGMRQAGGDMPSEVPQLL